MMFRFASFGLLIECDEHAHRDRKLVAEESHLAVIRQWLLDEHGLERMYVVRINPDGARPMFVRKAATNGEPIWKPTEHCDAKLQQVFVRLRPVLDAGLDDDEGWIEGTFAGTASGEPVVTEYVFYEKIK